jgi:hypothetical protein
MGWSQLTCEGFALAAAAADDPGAALAERGLTPSTAAALTREAKKLAGLEPGKRRQRIKRITARLRPRVPENPGLPARALALLAREVDRNTGQRWLDASPAPRPGYRPEPGLRAVIRRVAIRVGHEPDEGGLPRTR